MMLDLIPNVTLVVVDYQGGLFLSELLDCLSRQSFISYELILVDNGGSFSWRIIDRDFPIRILNPGRNLGFAEGCNEGARWARGEFIVLLNNDTVVAADWLEHLVHAAESDASIGAVCSKVVFFRQFLEVSFESESFVPSDIDGGEDSRRLGLRLSFEGDAVPRIGSFLREGLYLQENDSSGNWVWTNGRARFWVPEPESGILRVNVSSHVSLMGSAFSVRVGEKEQSYTLEEGVQRVEFEVSKEDTFDVINNAGNVCGDDWKVAERGIYERDSSAFGVPMDLDLACGCSLLIRRSCLEGTLFDPEFFAYSEDTDLSLRIRKAGWRILYEPKSVVRHHGSGTAVVQSAFQVFHATRNRFWVIAKHAPWKVIWKVASTEMTKLEWYAPWLNEEFSLSRLKRETWFGFVKRLWRRLCDSE